MPFLARRPTRVAMLSILVAAATVSAAAGSPGRGYFDGFPVVRMDAADWITSVVRDRIGSWPDSFNAHLCASGPMLIAAKLATPYVKAAFLRRRGSAIFCSNDTGTIARAFDHKHFAEEFVLAQPHAGTVSVRVR
jgi:hypothetical protein